MPDPLGERARPWRDEETLRRLYCEEKLEQSEIADRMECDQGTISNWLNKFGIEGRHERETHAVHYATFVAADANGYEKWTAKYRGETESVYVHRLAAVAWSGWDAVVGNYIHHHNRIKWDTREDNIEPMSPEEHGEIHGVEAHP